MEQPPFATRSINAVTRPLLQRQGVGRRAEAPGHVQGSCDEEELVHPVGGAVTSQRFKIEQLTDRNAKHGDEARVEGEVTVIGKSLTRSVDTGECSTAGLSATTATTP